MRTLYYICVELFAAASTAIAAYAGSAAAAKRIAAAFFSLVGLSAVMLGFSLFGSDAGHIRWATVAGYVLAADGTPIKGIRISFLNEASGVGASAETTAAGYYRARGVLPGAYVVSLQPIVPPSNTILTAEQAASVRKVASVVVPEKYQEFSSSPLHAVLVSGRNTFTVDLGMAP